MSSRSGAPISQQGPVGAALRRGGAGPPQVLITRPGRFVPNEVPMLINHGGDTLIVPVPRRAAVRQLPTRRSTAGIADLNFRLARLAVEIAREKGQLQTDDILNRLHHARQSGRRVSSDIERRLERLHRLGG
jgi:hypothetical protein